MKYKTLLTKLGASSSDIIDFSEDSYDKFDYIELINRTEAPTFLTAVIQRNDKTPVLYILDEAQLSSDPSDYEHQVQKAKTIVACRGDCEWLGVIKPGTLDIYQCNFELNSDPNPKEIIIEENPVFVKQLLNDPSDLVISELTGFTPSKKFLNTLLFDLFHHISEELKLNSWLEKNQNDILSLLGRALFTRFLIDRKIINPKTFPELYKNGDASQCFDTPELAATTSTWLDEKFNGELLPLKNSEDDDEYKAYFKRLHKAKAGSLKELSKLLHKTTVGGQLFLDITRVDFSFVPVGLLSQVYENYAHNFSQSAHNESVYYTPLHIAKYMVDQSFSGLSTCKKHEAVILDPTSGGGIFLVLCFKKIVSEYWKSTGTRPDTKQIRKILNKQIRGFDINDYALKLAALSLYLTAIELDPDPFPPEKLKFNKLIGKVLIPTRKDDEPFPVYPILGSLNEDITAKYNNQFDLIIGNPPWTKWKSNTGINPKVEAVIKRIICERVPALRDVAPQYRNEQNFSDTPFLWKSIEWAKPGANISLALHGRLIFRSNKEVHTPLQAIFRSIKVTGILNGTALRLTNFWPNMDQPFCLLFAKNKIPNHNDFFHFINPYRETNLNNESKATIDYKDAIPISFDRVYKRPSVFKSLFRGSILDLDFIDNLLDKTGPTKIPLGHYWKEALKLSTGEGYQKSGDKNPTKALKQLNAKHLSNNDYISPVIKPNLLANFNIDYLHRPRQPEIYTAPLIIFKHSFSAKREQIKAHISFDQNIIYSESFYGYSAYGHKEAKMLIMYLFALCNSDLFYYYHLMTNPKYGVERDQVYKSDMDTFPTIPFENINTKLKKELPNLINNANKNDNIVDDLSTWIYKAYNISTVDQSLIADTLANNSPTAESINHAESNISDVTKFAFIDYLQKELNCFLSLTDEKIYINEIDSTLQSWIFISLSKSSETIQLPSIRQLIAKLSGGKTQIKIIKNGTLYLGMPNQNRFWTLTRARLLIQDLLTKIEKLS